MGTSGNVLIGQSGGPTAVINQTLVGVVQAARASGAVGRILGSVHGIQGVLKGEICDFADEDAASLEVVAGTPSSALLSVRHKPKPEECQAILARCRQLDVRHFFYIGGNDTAETTSIIAGMASAAGYDLRCIHCPKTIDNDLRVTDHCPGYGSAARFVACAFMGDNLDLRSMDGVKVNVVMGRDAGWLTAASALARIHPDDGPHRIYLPEVDFDLARFCADVEAVYRRLGRCLIAVSEGIHGPGGAPIVDLGETDSHGNRQLSGSGALGDTLVAALKRHLEKAIPGKKHRLRADTFGYLQRCFPGVVSSVDAAEARMVGERAVAYALAEGAVSGSVALRRLGEGADYRCDTILTPLATVAKHTKPVPRDWINAAGDDVVAGKLLPYLAPLAGTLPATARLKLKPIVLPK